jgi:hypothetical protein
MEQSYMKKKDFNKKYNGLSRDIHKNYYKLENLIKSQLKEEGLKFFEDSDVMYLLSKSESTLPEFCILCEKDIQNLSQGMLCYLLFAYLHLHDRKNARRISHLLKEKGLENDYPYFLDGIDDFLPSENIFYGKYIIVQYDRRIENMARLLISNIDKVEEFIIGQWENYLPQKIFVYLINGIGSSPFNNLLYGIYLKVGQYQPSRFILDYLSGAVVHEITHMVMYSFITFHIPQEEYSSFKFIDEGYAEWKRTEYCNTHLEYKIYANNFAFHLLHSNLFKVGDIIENWAKIMVSFRKYPIYETATSFTYFLEDKFGYDKVNKLFSAIPDYPEIKTWTDYLHTYFESEEVDLMQEWRNKILEDRGSKESISEKIITFLKVESINDDEMVLHYKANYPLWAGHNIFIYDDAGRLQSIDKLEKYRFLKEGRLRMKPVKSERLTVFAHFFQYSQKFEFNLANNEIHL